MPGGRQRQRQRVVQGSEGPDRAEMAQQRRRSIHRIPCVNGLRRIVGFEQPAKPWRNAVQLNDGDQADDDTGEQRQVQTDREAPLREPGTGKHDVDHQKLQRTKHQPNAIEIPCAVCDEEE